MRPLNIALGVLGFCVLSVYCLFALVTLMDLF
jgi:hypothetical protein